MDGTNIGIKFHGTGSRLFWLAAKTSVLTLFTLGVYRFWARTRIRQYFWSSIAPGGQPLEYTGKGLEKFLGFLIAVAVLAVYLGIVQLLLSFFGMSIANNENPLAAVLSVYITFFAILPLIFYAQYRARRYMLSRTRWRGIRFAADQAAWAYTGRALVHSLVTLITLGLLLPRQTFYLEKFKADRTYYGSAQFEQHGKWTSLYSAMRHVFIGLAIIIVAIVLGGLSDWNQTGPGRWSASDGQGAAAVFLGIAGSFWAYFGFLYYGIHSHRYLTANKTLDGVVEFSSLPRTGTIIWIVIVGGFLMSIIIGILSAVFGGIIIASASSFLGAADAAGPPPTMIFATALLYILVMLAIGVLTLVFITQPIIQHYAQETEIFNTDHLDTVIQRDADDMMEAEGFADALDIGAAI